MNRRKFSRQPIQLSALVHPTQGRSWLCSIRDFCIEGMLLTGGAGSRSLTSTGGKVHEGDEVALHFSVPTPTGQAHFRTQAQIARILDEGNGLGVNFPHGLESEAFERLMEFAVASGTAVPQMSDDETEEIDESSVPSVDASARYAAGRAGERVHEQEVGAEPTKQLVGDAARTLRDRVKAVVQRGMTRLSNQFLASAKEQFLAKARDAGTNAVQTRYFEALEMFEAGGKEFSEQLVIGVLEQIAQVSDLEKMLERRRKTGTGSVDKLELVETNKFEQWLLVAERISKTENRFKDALLDMRAQLGLLAKPWNHKDVVPVGPSALWWTFDDALSNYPLHDELRKETFGLFEAHLHQLLPAIYEAIGKLFEDSGHADALEQLRESLQPKYRIRNRAGVAVAPQEYEAMDRPLRDANIAADNAGAGVASDNPFVDGLPAYDTARSLMSISRHSDQMMGKPREQGLAPENARPEEVFLEADILDALQSIQAEVGDTPLSDTGLREKLMNVLHSRHGDGKGLAEEDYDTLGMMEELVTSMTSDQLITDGVRDWVRRLEVTLNKLAAKDPEFLAGDSDHPHSAVQMLNQLARLGNSADVKQGIDRDVGRRVDELMQRVVQDYDDNPEVFAEVVDELHPLIDRQSRTYRGNIERTIRASEGQQKLARARGAVVGAVTQMFDGEEVPELVLELLNPGWRNLLVHTFLRHGPGSNEWQDQLELVDQLSGQLAGKIDANDEGSMAPEDLLRRIVTGLNSISFDPSKRTPLVMHMSSALVGDASGKKSSVRKVPVASDGVQKMLGLDGLLPDIDPQSDAADQSVRENWGQALERVRRVQVGEWLAASDKQGRPLILSVAFVGDEAASFVLVNRKGVKTLERSLKDMADDLHAGRITLLDDYDLPLMERASQRMLENMHSQLAFQASHDELTQLLNRKEFERVVQTSLADARAKGIQHALLAIDLDQFKIVNNTSGHRAGDELLRQVGEMLADKFGDQDMKVARLGGDEFGVLAENIDSSQAREVAGEILEAIREVQFEWEGRTYNITASIGMVFVDQSAANVDALMQHADEACFSAKDAGRNRLQEYELGDRRVMQRHGAMEWVTQLDSALENDRLILNCQKIQPIGDAADLHDVHYEILLSMRDELGDVVAPTDLINAAETYNRMTSIDRWVITNVLQWMSENRTMLDNFGGFAINVSGHSVNDTTFPDFVLEQFAKSQAPTSKVCFEITETAAIANLDNAVDFMNRMRIIGCRFSLDDFGTGLSSYSYLRNLPVDYVKIDGVFVRDISESPADYAVVRSINEIGHYMGKRTVAEYVESGDTLKSITEIGVDFAQGYEISKPGLLGELRA